MGQFCGTGVSWPGSEDSHSRWVRQENYGSTCVGINIAAQGDPPGPINPY